MIPVKHEKEMGDDPPYAIECCCFCRKNTGYWTQVKERTPGEQVACCGDCASLRNPEELPTKREWCDKERSLDTSPWARHQRIREATGVASTKVNADAALHTFLCPGHFTPIVGNVGHYLYCGPIARNPEWCEAMKSRLRSISEATGWKIHWGPGESTPL